MNKIIDNLDNIRLELKQKALVNGDTKCARMEHELKEQMAELITVSTIIDTIDEFLEAGNIISPEGAIHDAVKNLKTR